MKGGNTTVAHLHKVNEQLCTNNSDSRAVNLKIFDSRTNA